jgi:hypothetical protein
MKKLRLLGAVCACLISSISLSAHAVAVSGQGTWETTLQGRDLDGNAATFEAYYDTVLDVTWLADANYAGTQMDWYTASSWAAGLNINGVTDWRLPDTVDVGNDGCTTGGNQYQGIDCGYNITTHSEMSTMYYETLGNLAYCDTTRSCAQTGYGLTNTGPFSNLQSSYYRSATEYTSLTTGAWDFSFSGGLQSTSSKAANTYTWAVHDGDVGTAVVPIPPALWLFGSGLLGLLGMARRKS